MGGCDRLVNWSIFDEYVLLVVVLIFSQQLFLHCLYFLFEILIINDSLGRGGGACRMC